ncbi:hypothetical protein Srufu_004400 [Streptomyces libani subsp. rufus]|nr:hypothetical protein Srufu_004400 [Streptomyces libani subsp. rufus]
MPYDPCEGTNASAQLRALTRQLARVKRVPLYDVKAAISREIGVKPGAADAQQLERALEITPEWLHQAGPTMPS